MIQEEVFLKHVSFAEANSALQALERAGVQIFHDPRVKERARQIARRFNQRRVYDATYAALAQLRDCEFWTADRAFYEVVKSGLRFVDICLITPET